MKILLIASIAWVISQLSKVIYYYVLYKKINMKLFFASGGMPSGHSAFMTSIAAQIAIVEGIHSSLFCLAFSITLIVIYDSFNVRRSVGLQGQTINQMLDYYSDLKEEKNIKELKEVMGHTPLQVFCGIILGLLVSLIQFII